MNSNHNQIPRVITVDKNPAYPSSINELKNDKILPKNVGIQQIKYLNNIIEQDHRSIKRIVNPMLGFQSFRSANKTLKGIEAMNMIRKGQVKNLNYSVLRAHPKVITFYNFYNMKYAKPERILLYSRYTVTF